MIYFLDNSLQLQKIVTSKNVISAIHEHELNGLIRADVELDLAYANKFLILGIDHVGYYYKDEFYLHKIQRVEYDHVNESAKIVLRHIFFEDMIFGKLIRDVRPQNQDALQVSRQTIDANTRWQTIMTDVTGRLSTNFYWQVPYEVIEFMTENYRIEYLPKILFDGEKINGFQLHLANKIGEDKNIRIPYGSRVLDLKYEEDYSEIITKLVVHGKGEEVGSGYGRRINISDVDFSRNGVESPVGSLYLEDESITNTYGNDDQTPREGREVFEDIEDPNELAEAGYQHYLQVSRPQMLFTADVTDIGDVGIGDSVMIIRREYDVYFNARIHKLSVDLLYPEDAQVELGDYKHFKESKIARKTREKNNRVQGQLSDRITRLKLEANERFDNEVEQWKAEYEQALIDVHAEVEAAEVRMTEKIEGQRTEMTDEFNQSVSEAKEYAEQQAQAKADSVQSNLDSFEDSHQQLYDEVTENIIDIDTFLGDKSETLKQQFDKVHTDFGTLQTDLSVIESDLTATKSDLQNQLDEARAELDGLEVGGRNLLPAFTSDKWSHQNLTEIEEYSLYFPSGHGGNSIIFLDVEPNTNYTMTFNSDYARYYIYEVLEDESLGSIIRTRTGSETYTFNTEDISRIRVSLSTFSGNVQEEKIIWNLKLEKGTVATDWTPAPEDTEAKITTLNQSIEFINGQLSAKLEQKDIEPINNKITEYGNTLTANAQSIESLIEKTELHDDDITQWSNQTTATAEELTRSLTRISSVEGDLSTAKNTLTETADELSRTLTRVTNAEDDLEQAQLDISATADGLSALVTKTDGQESKLAELVIDVDGIGTTVAGHNEWLGTFGSAAEQTIEGFSQKVWLNDVANIEANLIPFSDTQNRAIMVENWEFLSDGGSTFYTGVTSSNFFTLRNTRSGSHLALQSRRFDRLVAGHTYTLSFHIQRTSGVNSNYNYTFIVRPPSVGNFILGSPTRITDNGDDTYTHEYVFTSDYTGEAGVRIGAYTNSGEDLWLRIKEPKLERGTKRTPYMTAFSVVEQRAEELSLRVQELSSINGEELITQSDISVLPDRVLIGSQNIGAIDMASIISVSPTAIDLISDKINVTGNVNISGGVTALAVDAIEGNFARLFTSQLTADVIKSSHIEASTTLVDKLFASNARIDELVTKNHYVNSAKALTIEAVYADLKSVTSQIMETNILKADWIQGGNALLDKVFANTAMFQRMMAKSGFVTSLSAITLDLHELTIWRPDGVAFVQNGMERFGHPVPLTIDISDDVTYNNKYFETNARGAQQVAVATGDHAGRYYNLIVGVGMRNDAQHASTRMAVIIRPQNVPSGASGWVNYVEEFTVFRGNSMQYHTLNYPMGRPTYGAMSFTIEFWRIGDSGLRNPVQLRTRRSWVSA